MVRPRAWSYVLLLPLLVLLMGGRQVPLNDPAPIAVPANVTLEQVAKVDKVALLNRGWSITDEQDGRILSTLNLRSHTARIEVTYDQSKIALRYVDSNALMYEVKKGQQVIHRNYEKWIQNLVTDISRNLQIATL